MTENTLLRRDLLLKSLALGAGLTAGNDLFQNKAFGQSVYNPNITELTQFVRGDLPILIVAPHGGTELVNGIEARRNVNRPVSNFSYYCAVWTREICVQISRTIKQLSGGKSPYMVLNLAHRRYVDVNREESDAYEAILNAPRIYWEYHDFINEYVNRMNVLYDNPIMIEISGQSDLPDLIVRRTLNGKTVQRLITQYGDSQYQQKLKSYMNAYEKIKDAEQKKRIKNIIAQYEELKEEKIFQNGKHVYAGSNSLIGEIKKRGYRINPDLNETRNEQVLTIAGNYSLERYGTRDVSNVNVIQLVIGSDYRRTSNYLQTGRDLGNAIWSFAQRYIVTQDILS
jgi:hypothetical protein